MVLFAIDKELKASEIFEINKYTMRSSPYEDIRNSRDSSSSAKSNILSFSD
jgi:hypothetical protein